ncbi:MAG: prephenate dehydratase [Cyclobacteriaceae bacterium]|nr:prephenate dehydratase [Cyclobacteriaceae bacterium]
MPKIAIQGIHGCFHEMAARKHFGESIDVLECQSFKSLCFELENKQCDFAVMAIENTLAGSLLPNYSLIRRFGFYVVGEVYLHIKMNLMAKPGVEIKDINSVMSHPVALAQCEEYLETLPHIEVKEYHDTAAAAKWVSDHENNDVAAISNELSAELYSLNILERGIETHKKNFTRFLVLSRDKMEIEGANKASLSLEVSHTPGSLADVLTIFKDFKVNLTKIQSIPIIGKPYQYAFKIDVTWDNKENYLQALEKIDKTDNNIRVLGIYKGQNFEN